MIDPGARIELYYPDSTLVESITQLELRRIEVHRVRDLIAEPLTPEEFLRRPFTRRSRWLVSGYDLDLGEWRKFYLGNSLEHESPGVLRVGLYEPGGSRPAHPFPLAFGPSRYERRILAKAILEWKQRDLHDLLLRIYADDVRLVA